MNDSDTRRKQNAKRNMKKMFIAAAVVVAGVTMVLMLRGRKADIASADSIKLPVFDPHASEPGMPFISGSERYLKVGGAVFNFSPGVATVLESAACEGRAQRLDPYRPKEPINPVAVLKEAHLIAE